MKKEVILTTLAVVLVTFILSNSCSVTETNDDELMKEKVSVIFLHHSTGRVIWKGKTNKVISVFQKISKKLFKTKSSTNLVPKLVEDYNKTNGTNYGVIEQYFPKKEPYGWNNYPFDYYNIWVKNAGEQPYLDEPTLEMLTREYDIVMFKHCFPVSSIKENQTEADINSDYKSLDNYKLQYDTLKKKLHQFPDNKFILWTGAALVKNNNTEESAQRAREFFNWVKEEWDQEGDNIYLWDFYELQTEGGLYFLDDYAVSNEDSHPSPDFAEAVAPLLVNRLIDIIENEGVQTDLKGNMK